MKISLIITAGGIGKRMGTDQPKQFLLLDQKPVLMHTIHQLHRFSPVAQIIITLPEQHIVDWKELCNIHDFTIPHTIIPGGKERFHSIQNALVACTGDYIAVHDGVRPFVSQATLKRCFVAVEKHPAVIPVIEVKESLREITFTGNTAVERAAFRIVQTPQVFLASVLHEAYQQPYTPFITDDASLVEQLGVPIQLVEGNEENIKLTNPADLLVATQFLKLSL